MQVQQQCIEKNKSLESEVIQLKSDLDIIVKREANLIARLAKSEQLISSLSKASRKLDNVTEVTRLFGEKTGLGCNKFGKQPNKSNVMANNKGKGVIFVEKSSQSQTLSEPSDNGTRPNEKAKADSGKGKAKANDSQRQTHPNAQKAKDKSNHCESSAKRLAQKCNPSQRQENTNVNIQDGQDHIINTMIIMIMTMTMITTIIEDITTHPKSTHKRR